MENIWVNPIHDSIIKAHKHILNLKDNWDEEGAKSYKEQTFITASGYLTLASIHIYEEKNKVMDVPSIMPSANGGIDLFWSKKEYVFFIKFPEKLNDPIDFYAKNNSIELEGKFSRTDIKKFLNIWSIIAL